MNNKIRLEMDQYGLILKQADTRTILESVIDEALVPASSKTVYVPPSRSKTEQNTPMDKVTSPYGKRVDPINKKHKFHTGIDLAAAEGQEIKGWQAGKVIKIGYDDVSGKHIILDHGKGFRSSYSHLSEIFVQKGQTIGGGEVIGLAGSTGRATGPHLHFRLSHDGKHIDPTEYLFDVSLVGAIRKRNS